MPVGNKLAKPKGRIYDYQGADLMSISPADRAKQAEYEYLQTPLAIRERCGVGVPGGRDGEHSEHWLLDESKLAAVAYIARGLRTSAQRNYPDLTRIPYHGRYRHFDVGGVPRLKPNSIGKSAQFSGGRASSPRHRFELVISMCALGRWCRVLLALSRY